MMPIWKYVTSLYSCSDSILNEWFTDMLHTCCCFCLLFRWNALHMARCLSFLLSSRWSQGINTLSWESTLKGTGLVSKLSIHESQHTAQSFDKLLYVPFDIQLNTSRRQDGSLSDTHFDLSPLIGWPQGQMVRSLLRHCSLKPPTHLGVIQ